MLYGSDQFGSDARFGNDGLTQLLIHFDGALLDSSKNHFTVSALGTGAVSTAQSKFGGSSLLVGTGGVSVADNASLELGTSDFTIEFWIYFTSTAGNQVLLAKGSSIYPLIIQLTAGAIVYYISSNGSTYDIANNVNFGTAPSTGVWSHFALVRSGSTFTPYINGTSGTTASSASGVVNDATNWGIGSTVAAANPVVGHVDEARFSIGAGAARWTANFTPPPMPYGL